MGEELGVERASGQRHQHSCLYCGEEFGLGVFLQFLKSIGNPNIECPVCYKAHYFDDDEGKTQSFVIAAGSFLISGLISGIAMGMLIMFQWVVFGWIFNFELVLPLILAAIGGGIGLKLYHWRTKRLVKYGD